MTLLYITAALSIGIGVALLVAGEVGLSGTGRDSQFAFYAADFGAECALYWDLKHHRFEIPTEENGLPDQFTIQCGGAGLNVSFVSPNKFIFASLNPRFDVTFERLDGGGGQITARGYAGQAGRRVERGLRVEY
ncbi:MAG: hypothetical protein HYT22_01460 [Candidatus Niyogibacteria bacterium]|nr:hypothetical protein [Candidatus Niyogibacteria bacterium]